MPQMARLGALSIVSFRQQTGRGNSPIRRYYSVPEFCRDPIRQASFLQPDRSSSRAAYDIASEVMACNLLLDDAAEGIDAFLQKRSAIWRGK